MASFVRELKRRRVFRVAVLYIIVSWVLMQVVDVAAPALLLPDWVPSFVMLLLIVGFPVAMLLAWAYDLTPEGIKVTKPLSESADPDRVLNTDANITGVASPDSPKRIKTSPDSSIAVLPFVNVSPDPDNEYFSDGITEELINVLARVKGLKVAARTSSFHFKGRKETLKRVGEELGVGTVLEGSVRATSGRVRVAAQLAKVTDGYQLWAGTYDRNVEDLLQVQDEIVKAIVDALKVRLLSEDSDSSALTHSDDAYQAYLRGRFLWQRRDPESIAQGIELLREAVALDPKFSHAYAALAAAYHKSSLYDANLNEKAVQRLAESAAREALRLDSNLAEASATLGSILADQHHFVEAHAAFAQALANGRNNAGVHHWYSVFLLNVGRLEQAREHIEVALDIDPLNPTIFGTRGSVCLALGLIDEAIGALENASQLGWTEPAEAFLGAAYLYLGESGKAKSKLQAGRFGGEVIPDVVIDSMVDTAGTADLVGEQLASGIESGSLSCSMAYRLCALVGSTKIFELPGERRAVSADALAALWYPSAASIRKDARFAEFVGTFNLPGVWQELGGPDGYDLVDGELLRR